MEKVKIAKLNGSNYQIWKFKTELLLTKEDLWDVVSDELPAVANRDAAWQKRNGKAKATIGLLVEDNKLGHIRKETTAHGVWNVFKGLYEKSTLTNKVFLLKRLCRMQMSDNCNMEDHLNVMLDIVDQLEALGEKLKDDLVVALLLCSLPDSYDNLIIALEGRKDEDLTLDMVKTKLISEYMRRNENECTTGSMEEVLRVSQNPKAICYKCNKKGHFQRDCTSKWKNGKSTKESAKEVAEVESAKKISGNKDVEASDDSDDGEVNYCFTVSTPITKPKNRCLMMRNALKKINKNWYIDSGATSHMSNNFDFFTKIDMKKDVVTLANGDIINVEGIGTGVFRCIDYKGKVREIQVKNVLYVPELESSLLSVKKLTKLGFKIEFEGDQCSIFKDGINIATGISESNLFKLNIVNKVMDVEQMDVKNCIHKWHRRFGHRDINAIKQLVSQELVDGIQIESCDKKMICDCCMKGKISRLPFLESTNRSEEILNLVHSDVCPMPVDTPGRNKYILTIIDDFSRFTKIYLLREKSEAYEKIKEYVREVENEFQRKPKTFRCDGGGEYICNNVRNFFKRECIKIQRTAAYTPQQNGVAERKNRYLVEMIRCMLFDANLNKRFWDEAANTATYLQNILPTRTTGKTPFELWYKRKPDVSHLKTFGCIAYAVIPKQKRRKLDEKAKKLTFVGYAEGTKAYRLINPSTNELVISRDVRFVEDTHQVLETYANWEFEDFDFEIENVQNEENADQNHLLNENEGAIGNEDIEEARNDIIVRKSIRETKGIPPERFSANIVKEIVDEPKTFKEASSGHDKNKWMDAMKDEIKSLHDNVTWNLTELPSGRKAIGCKWVYKLKTDADGQINRYKARLVAQGFSQKFGVDYDEVFAPVVRHETIRTLLAIAGQKNMVVRHYDVKTAFLYGELSETIL